MSVPVNFNTPVWLPPPNANIEGDVADFIGSWIELNSDGTVCNAADDTTNNGVVPCIQVDIGKGAGGIVGTIRGDEAPHASSDSTQVSGPFAQATNPDVGYPTTVSPNDYFYAEQWCSNVGYQMLDGVVNSGSLSFWFSPLDLWTDWCALQTPGGLARRG